jgi:hypothetical protein
MLVFGCKLPTPKNKPRGRLGLVRPNVNTRPRDRLGHWRLCVLMCGYYRIARSAPNSSIQVMVRLFRLLLRPVEGFLAQCISISTEPSAFVRERVHLGDTRNFLRAAKFFFSTVCAAFFAEVATLYLLGIGNIAEPYYWLFVLLTSIPFVLFSFLLVRFVAPLSFKDVLHLCFYPIGAGVFTGAALTLVASAVVAALVAFGFIPEIRYDFTQGAGPEQLVPALRLALYDCLKGESLLYTVVAAGLQEAYSELKSPIDSLSYVRPVITVLYLFIAARFFMAAVDRRKAVVFGIACLAAVLATSANVLSLWAYLGGESFLLRLCGTARKRATWPRSYSRASAERFCSEVTSGKHKEQRVVGCISTRRRTRTSLQLSF